MRLPSAAAEIILLTNNIIVDGSIGYDDRVYYKVKNQANAGWATTQTQFPGGPLWKDLLSKEAYGSEGVGDDLSAHCCYREVKRRRLSVEIYRKELRRRKPPSERTLPIYEIFLTFSRTRNGWSI